MVTQRSANSSLSTNSCSCTAPIISGAAE